MKKIFKYALFTAFAFIVTSCEKIKDFGDTNTSPDGTTIPNISALLTNVEAGGIGSFASNGTPAINGAQYAQYFTETQYPSTSLYALPQISFAGYYSGNLYDLQNIINLNQSKNMNNVATILQQYIFWVMTDSWGDIPYSEALKGIEKVTPKYDTQEQVYKGIISTLTATVSAFDNSPITGDIIYNGDVASWKRMANSLRMMAVIQLSKRYPNASDYAGTEFSKALTDAGGYITSNAQNFDINYEGSNYKSNWWSLYDGRKDYAESKTVTDLTGSLGDGRQNAFGGSSEVPGSTGTSNVGIPYGLDRTGATAFTDANTNWARVLRGDLRNTNGTVVMIGAADVALARAEAADRGWTSENLTSVYQGGIALSFEQWGIAAPSSGYLNQSNVAVSAAPGTGANIKNISVQRYLAAYPDGHKGWNVWRKSGFPALTPAPAATNSSKQIVRRFTYAPTEASTNGASLKEAISRIPGGVDSQDAKVWWDQ
ncbi:SusD/RagB family nutrient-binding outer membrane lipoprotein [Pedobacter sp. HMF7647]|uniref:SusD/RagB family nutrient-binding outer membrane lipoprotein n=1 Tax=Hufsiella arboris TaxID=2695275 RepID=A0A7K1Y5M5_9SPHI|nr:SusD/RagB family nutrient-binding outer membrane lipoprotein [Hufsiella arboris]MXV49884.1 SusD/RagB family nutrient-binding outer membrane lipoprotein [Hufsiella arboris]